VNAAPTCDVLCVGHHGLEGYTDIGAIWARGLHRRTVRVRFWRERAASIPRDEDTQRAWLAERWQQMDDWIAAIPSEGGHDA